MNNTNVVFGIHNKKEVHRFLLLSEVLEFHYDSRLNRCVDKDRVDEIYESFINELNIQGVISITFAVLNNERMLVDGQHRLEALKLYLDNHSDKEFVRDTIFVHVREIEVSSRDEATRLHVEMGKTVPAKIVENELENNFLRQFDQFLLGCLNRPKDSITPQYGNWPKGFSDVVKNTGFFTKFTTPEVMMKEIMDLNACLFKNVVQSSNGKIRKYITDGKPEKFATNTCKLFCDTYKLSPSDRVMCLYLIVRYGFMEIILDKTSNHPELTYERYLTLEKRLNFNDIPSMAAEGDSLERFFGKPQPGQLCRKPCPVCLLSMLDRDERSSYHFGHIVSRAKGGRNVGSNLVPICPRCNLDCRSKDLNEYCREMFGRDIQQQ